MAKWKDDILNDDSKIRILGVPRQIGITTMLFEEIYKRAMEQSNGTFLFVDCSTSHVLRAFKRFGEMYKGKISKVSTAAMWVGFENGSEIHFCSHRAGLRGFCAEVYLDNFSYYSHPNDVMACVIPMIMGDKRLTIVCNRNTEDIRKYMKNDYTSFRLVTWKDGNKKYKKRVKEIKKLLDKDFFEMEFEFKEVKEDVNNNTRKSH